MGPYNGHDPKTAITASKLACVFISLMACLELCTFSVIVVVSYIDPQGNPESSRDDQKESSEQQQHDEQTMPESEACIDLKHHEQCVLGVCVCRVGGG